MPHRAARKDPPLRQKLAAIIVALAALGAVVCGGGPKPASTPSPAPTATSTAPDLTVFRGFIFPIRGACLPTSDNLMPNAARSYRDGKHEGVDMYQVDNCTQIGKGTPVMAAKDGTVIRADHNYHDLTQQELDAADARIAAGHASDPDILDLFRGRQVWIDHGHGIVTRYAHLSAIADGIEVGSKVAQGETIAFVGDSGTPESITDPTAEMHLHFELRVGDTYLGRDQPPAQVRAEYQALFTQLP